MSKSQTVLITGATGFVGAHLVRFFARSSYYVIAMGRMKNPPNPLLVHADEYVAADITRDTLPAQADIIIHAAGLASDTSSWDELYRVNVIGTQRVYEEIKHQFFIHISSSSVYSSQQKNHCEDEDILLKELNPYGRTKRLAELYLAHKADVCMLRPRAIYGINDRVLLPKILGMRKGRLLIAPCQLNSDSSLTQVNNLIQAINLCIQNEGRARGQIFNVADGRVYSLKTVISSLHKVVSPLPIRWLHLPLSFSKNLSHFLSKYNIKSKLNKTALDMLCRSSVLDVTKIEKQLNYQPLHYFEETLPIIEKWLKKKDLGTLIQNPDNIPWDT